MTVGCMIASIRYTATRKDNRKMAMLTVEDLTGKCEAVAFPRAYEQFGALLAPEAMVFITGTVDRRRDRGGIIIENVTPIDLAVERVTAQVLVRIAPPAAGHDLLGRLAERLEHHHGNCPLLLELTPTDRQDVRATVRPDRKWFVRPSRKLLDELTDLLGQKALVLTARPEANGNGSRGSRRTYPRRSPRPDPTFAQEAAC